jgi:hypothetical protein
VLHVSRPQFSQIVDGALLGRAAVVPTVEAHDALRFGPGGAVVTVELPRRLAPGVYPVSVALRDDDGEVASSFVTHLVRLPDDVPELPLSVAWLQSVDAKPSLQPDGERRLDDDDLARLRVVAAAVGGAPGTAVTLDVTPEALEALEAAGEDDTLEGLRRAAIRPAMQGNLPPDFVWLLNPDTVVLSGALRELLGFMQANPEAGLAGSRLENPDGSVQRSAFRFPSVAAEIDNGLRLGLVTRLLSRKVIAPEPPVAATRTDWLSGASLLVRSQVFRDVGFMDEAYFMYFEETDFCRRARNAGWHAWYVPASRVIHLVGQASGMNQQQQNRRRADYWFQSRRRYFLKHLGKVRTAAADGLFMIGFATWRIRRRLQRKPDPDPVQFLGDFARWSVWRRGFRLGG